jgi:DeoR/GlpR family transcriptional regulator of sugar metabolism
MQNLRPDLPQFAVAGARLMTEQRREQIAELVEQSGSITTDAVAKQFAISLMTVWRDLAALEETGRLRRIRGGAVRLDRRPEAEPFYVSKQVINQAKKESIAHYAAQRFIADGDIVFMEAGTTVAAMAKHLPAFKHLTVVGNGLGTMNELAKQLPGITVFCCGGMLRDVGLTFVGPQAEAYFRQINARTCFLSATGITTAEGVTDPNLLEIQVKRAMAHSAERVVLLMDSSKFGARSLSKIFDVREVAILVTDEDAPAAALEEIAALGVEVHRAPRFAL